MVLKKTEIVRNLIAHMKTLKLQFHLILSLGACLYSLSAFSQEVSLSTMEKIYEDGKAFTMALRQGQIENLKNATPPPGTWEYPKLEAYKQELNSADMIYGEFVMPSADEAYYSYNLFAYNTMQERYYFVAIVSFEVVENGANWNAAYLFTEKQSLKDWWVRTFGFYDSDLVKKVPENFLYKTCPPPPFKD